MGADKYNFAIHGINPYSTHGKILSRVEPGSHVLECGCASGYMTQFMHEQMGCEVDIIEIDEECYKKAKRYAEYGYCGNLEDFGTIEWFAGRHYDCILFADVLEHLRDPLSVLKKVRNLLKDDGKIVISIPNICHNDVIVRMWYDHFNYSDIGLLDNTHVHFWGGNDIEYFLDQAGMKLTDIDVTVFKTQTTEQRYPFEIDPELLQLLSKRKFGEVYQYIFRCEKK